MLVRFPSILAINEKLNGNPILQVRERPAPVDGDVIKYRRGKLSGFLFRPASEGDEVLIVDKRKHLSDDDKRVVRLVSMSRETVDLSTGEWIKHPLLRDGEIDYAAEVRRAINSWENAFSYTEEDRQQGLKGLRTAQAGAVHAVHAHWSISRSPATIVMPTGTGKTEVMLSVLVSASCSRLLVVVPTDALRTQLAEKFITLGILKNYECTILRKAARYPVVGALKHIPRNAAEVDGFFNRCNVIVTTSSIAGRCNKLIQDQMAQYCPYLFIDEAHHTEAPTWKAFKARFTDNHVLQFTATPFREDGKSLDGEIIYRYPLRKAQEQGYFQPIRFCPIVEFNPSQADAAVAEKAVEQLRHDSSGRQILMARVGSIRRAAEVFKLYSRYAEFRPIELHTGIQSSRKREELRNRISQGKSRIVICVDMLGEGFDLPELKIAAFHDIRKTLAVTLQLAGRFTRARSDLGEATFIANIADLNVQEELRKLYTQDPDWNHLLPELSDEVIDREITLTDFLRNFTRFPDAIPLKDIRPAMSTVVYSTKCQDWRPENFREGLPGSSAFERLHHALNPAKNTLLIITAARVALPWIDSGNIFQWDWTLYIITWVANQNLLFINSSANAGQYRSLARSLAGTDVELIHGEQVFKSFAGVNRLKLQNVGLTELLGRNVRYTGRMGSDVESGLSEVQKRRARKAVLAGSGFESGNRASIGASRKGRIWSHRRGTVADWVQWCRHVGQKILDERVSPNEVLQGTLEAKTVSSRPIAMPISIDWPEEIYKVPEVAWSVEFGGERRFLSELSIELVGPNPDGQLRFALAGESERVEIELELYEENESPNCRFVVLDSDGVWIRQGERAMPQEISRFFYREPPVIWFADGSSLEGCEHVELRVKHPPYDPSKIKVWDWTGTNLRQEAQGREKIATSIQARVIRELRHQGNTIIVDDDGSGEIADVVAIRLIGDPGNPAEIEVDLYHCKYSTAGKPGQRIKDLYEVCGQAQKCISWLVSPERQTDIFTHLLRRNALRMEVGGPSRIELGNEDQLLMIREISRQRPVRVKVSIVQPGLSKEKVSRDQLELLSVTENHLLETYQVPFEVIASAE